MINDESVNLETLTILTPADQAALDNRVQEKARRKRAGIADAAPSVFGVVGTLANPYLSLLRDLQAGKITLNEFEMSIDAKVISDPVILDSFSYLPEPTMPHSLADAWGQTKEAAYKQPPAKRQAILDAFEAEAKEQGYKSYFESRDAIRAENKSNLFALEEMLNRNQSNAVYVGRLTLAIATHKEARR